MNKEGFKREEWSEGGINKERFKREEGRINNY